MRALNGLPSYLETYFEIVERICIDTYDWFSIAFDINEAKGRSGLYELAEKLTDEFEELYKDFNWDEMEELYFIEKIKEFMYNKNRDFNHEKDKLEQGAQEVL